MTLTIKDASIRSRIGIQELYKQAKTNPSFPAFKVGKKTLIHAEAFDNWVANLAKQRAGFRK